MAFDPDAFLAQQSTPSQLFDPDAFLSSGAEPEVAPEQKVKWDETPADQSFLREVADVPLKLAGGVTTGVRLIADAFGADSDVSKNLRGAEEWISKLYSAQSKQDSQEVQSIMKAAEDQGVGDQVIAGLKAFTVAPIDMIVNALGTSAPAIVAGLLGVISAPVGGAAVLGAGALMGAGTIKGAIYDATKEILSEQGGISPEQIEAAAIKAQEYGGENLDQILLGAGVGAIAGRTGAEASIIRQLSKSILGKAAATEAGEVTAEAAARAAVTKKIAERGMAKQAGITAATELGTEGFQGGQEQFAANLAQQRQGFDTPLMRGVVGQGTLEGLAGAGLGAVTGARESMSASDELARNEALSSKLDPTDQQKLLTNDNENLVKNEPLISEEDAAQINALGAEQVVANTSPKIEAEKYLAAVEGGKTPSYAALKNIFGSLKIEAELPKGPGAVKAAVELLKTRLPTIGETDATRTDTAADGAGADVVEPARVDEASTSASGVGTGGVDATGANAGEPAGGAVSQLNPLSSSGFSAAEIAGKFDPDAYLGGTKAGEEVNLDKLFSAAPADAPAVASVTDTANSTQVAADEAQAEYEALNAQVSKIENERAGLLTNGGKLLPFPNSPARKKYDELTQQVGVLRGQAEDAAKRADKLFATTKEMAGDTVALSPEDQTLVDKKRVLIKQLVDNSAPQAEIDQQRRILNTFLESKGVSNNTLPAKALTFPQRRKINNPSVRAALAKTPEERKEGVMVQNLPPDVEEKYSVAREELLSNIKEHNAKRKPLIEAVAAAKEKLVSLRKNKASEEDIGVAEDALSDTEFDLEEYGAEITEPAKWSKLASWEKDILFDSIKAPSIQGPYEADILDYRDGVAAIVEANTLLGDEGVTENADERRIMVEYDRNRNLAKQRIKREIQDTTGRGVNFSLPRWADLSDKAKNLFRSAVQSTNPDDSKTEPSLTLEQQDAGYEAIVGQIIVEENARGELSAEVIQQREKQLEKFRAQREKNLAELKETQKDYEKRTSGARTAGATILPNNVILQLKQGNLNAAIDMLLARLDNNKSKSVAEKLQIQVLMQLRALKLKTKVSVASDILPDYDLAHYYSDSDQIVFSPSTNSFTVQTLAHEVTHAATITVLYRYINKQYNMITAQQRAAAAQIEKLFKVTKPFLGEEFPNAYDNPFEFVAYAMTNKDFAKALSNLGVKDLYLGVSPEKWLELTTVNPEIIDRLKKLSSILPAARSAWSVFKQAVAEIIGIPKGRMVSVNYLMEMHAAFEDILSVPVEPIYLTGKAPLAAKQPKKTPKVVEKGEEPKKESDDPFAEDPLYRVNVDNKGGYAKRFWRRISTKQGWQDNISDFQDATYQLDAWQKTRTMTGQINFDQSGKFTNIATQGTRAMAEGRNFYTEYLQAPLDTLQAQLAAFANKYDLNLDKRLLPTIQKLGELWHEPERRRVNFIMRVPLSKLANLIHNGKKISAADRRIQLVGDENTGREGLIHRIDLTEAQLKAIRTELDYLADNHAAVDNGYGPALTEEVVSAWGPNTKISPANIASQKAALLKEDSSAYAALGIDKEGMAERETIWKKIQENPEQAEEIKAIFATLQKIVTAQKVLDKKGNYWSRPVTNLVGIYGYEHYLPYQGFNEGQPKRNNPDAMGAEYQTVPRRAMGRQEDTTAARNPVLQLLTNSVRAAGRAGRRHYTQSIYNAVTEGLVPKGEIIGHVTFMERESNPSVMDKYKGANKETIFHYNHDGSIDIIRIGDPKLLDAMRQTFKDDSPITDFANTVTGFFGAMHTRYNYNFAPLNFVRDSLTNAWNIGASGDMGPVEAAKYIKHVSTMVAKNGLGKAWQVARLHERADKKSVDELAALIEKDSFVKDMLEMMKYGGKTTYLEGLSVLSALEKLEKSVNKTITLKTGESITNFFDAYNYAFEFTSRTAAYTLRKEGLKKKFIADGMAADKAEVAAATEAATWTKNLANFEKIGLKGRGMGALYMFFRPSVTGAVRAAQAALPGMPFSEKYYVDNLPDDVKADEKLKAKYLENFRKDRKNARVMITGLLGSGYAIYMMAALMSPDDDEGRNNVKSDNMQQWTRYARFHLSDKVIIQMPWGFGLGAFAATGAQVASILHGPQSLVDGLNNIMFSIMTDAFLPLPISRMSPTENPIGFAVDSVAPTALRPLVEFFGNTDGLGRTINSTFQRRMGDAYTGGDRINEVYKSASKYLYEATDGAVEISPNSMYFLVNSYADGAGKFTELLTSSILLAQDTKDFVPKTDIPIFGSFIGSKSNVDSREYGQMEQKVKNIDKRMNTLEQVAPDSYDRFIDNNPDYPQLVEIYKAGQGKLNKIRKEMNIVRGDQNLSVKERNEELEYLQKEQNMLKYGMNEWFKDLGLKP